MAKEGNRGDWLREGRGGAATHAIEKTPQFRASMERFAERAADQLGKTFGGLFVVAADGNRTAKTFATLTAALDQPAALLTSPTLEQQMALLFQPGCVDILIGAMFGFEAANDEGPPEETKAPTPLELRMIGEVAGTLARALCDAFAPVADFNLVVEKAELLEDDTLLGAKDPSALIATIQVKAPTGVFGLSLLLPHPFLTALAAATARGPAPGAAKLDPVWSSRMERRVTEASLTLTAVLDEFQMTLADVSTLRVGHLLPLSKGGEHRVRIDCGERGVFICSLGERSGRYALEVEDIIARPIEGSYPATTA